MPTLVSGPTTSNLLSFSIPSTTGKTLILMMAGFNPGSLITGITLGGSADNWVRLGSATFDPGHIDEVVEIWADPNCAAGQTAVVVSGISSTSIDGSDGGLWVAEYDGLALPLQIDINQGNPEGAVTTWGFTTSSPTTDPGELWLLAVALFDQITSGPGAGWLPPSIPDDFAVFGYQIPGVTGSPSCSGSQTAGGQETTAELIITLKPAGAGAGPTSDPVRIPVARGRHYRSRRRRQWPLPGQIIDGSGTAPPTPVTLADQAAAAESETVAAAVPLADDGAAAESISIAVTTSLADTAGAADNLPQPPVAISLSDDGAAAESVAITAAVPLADEAGAADSDGGAAVTTSGTDTGAGTDSASIAAAVPLADTGAGTDSVSVAISIAITLADEGAAADALAITAAVPLSDAGGAADSDGGAAVTASSSDQAAAAEQLAVSAALALPDTGAAADSVLVTAVVPVTLADVAAAVEGEGVNAAVPEADTGAAADKTAVAAAVPMPDTAGGTEALSAVAAVPLADQGAAADSISILSGQLVTLADQGAAAEQLALSAQIAVADTAAAADQSLTAVSDRPADAAGAADSLQILVVLPGTFDTAAAADSLTVQNIIGSTGHVHWAARPSGPRWKTEPARAQWLASAAGARWMIDPAEAQWDAEPAQARWRIQMTSFDPIAAVSLENVNVTWTADLAGTTIDPTVAPLTVQMAFPVSSGDELRPAEPVSWLAASWLADGTSKGFVAQCLVGPGGGTVTLTAGQVYDVWSKVLGSPEVPARFAGQLRVY